MIRPRGSSTFSSISGGQSVRLAAYVYWYLPTVLHRSYDMDLFVYALTGEFVFLYCDLLHYIILYHIIWPLLQKIEISNLIEYLLRSPKFRQCDKIALASSGMSALVAMNGRRKRGAEKRRQSPASVTSASLQLQGREYIPVKIRRRNILQRMWAVSVQVLEKKWR